MSRLQPSHDEEIGALLTLAVPSTLERRQCVGTAGRFPHELILEVGKFLASPFDGSLRALLSVPQVFSGMCNGTVPRMGSTQEDDSNESGNADNRT